MRKIVLAALAIMVATIVNAAPAYPGLMTANQADGSSISYYLHGDEHFSYITSTDGYLMAWNEAGMMEYGDFSNGKYVVPTGVAAHDESSRSLTEQMYVRGLQKVDAISPRLEAVGKQMRMQSAVAQPVMRFPRNGSPRSIIILVSFSDKKFTKTKQNFEDLANKPNYSDNGGTGSIRDYFTEASFGQFTPQFDVYGPYTLPHDMAFYGEHVGSQNDVNAQQMVVDACNAAYNAGVDFSKYDADGNGTIDNVFIYYAGNNEAESPDPNTIWPHRSRIYIGTYTFNDKILGDYACTSEFRGNGSYMCGIGTFCHEFSHVVGLPDFYDTDYSAGYSAMGSWDIMTSGNYNNGGNTPPTYTAYERFYVGWLTPTPLTEDINVDCEGSYSLNSLISSNEAYIISKTSHNLNGNSPNPTEFFMLEYRKREGRDTHTEIGEGMLITHIVFNSSTWGNNGPNNDRNNLGYEPILPTKYSVSGSSYDCFPGSSGVNYCQFTPRGSTDPFKREVINIEDKGTYCEFDYIKNVTNLQLKVRDIDAYTNEPNAVEEFEVNGYDIEETVTLSFKTSSGFKMRKKGDSQYQSSLTLTPAEDNTINETIEVQYTPNKVTYDAYEYNKFIATGSSGKLTKIVDFRYRNRRPVYITTPEANEAQEVNGSSFTASWSYVNDTIEGVKKGAKYYLDLYTISDEKYTEVESFENFPTMSEGWSANFNTTNSTYKKDGNYSVQFGSSLDTLWSKEYLADVTDYSFWIESITSEGILNIEVQNHETGSWVAAKNIVVNSSTKGDQTGTLPEGYRRFRISYAQTKGQLAFDCFSASTASTTTFVCKDEMIADTFYKASGLKANTEYKYVVRSTDKDEKGRYENISDYSNEVVVLTKEGGDAPKKDDGSTSIALKVALVEGANRYVVSVSEVIEGYSLFIYGMDGKLVKKVAVTSSEVVVPELMDGVYILKYTKDGKNNKKDGVTKMYYHLK